jgi:hypothetical protein
MEKTYKVTEVDKDHDEAFVVETTATTSNQTYQKEWIVSEIARLTALLNQFAK